MDNVPQILHIDIKDNSLPKWLQRNQFIIFSELIRYSEKILENNIDILQAIIVSNSYDNIVFIIKRKNIDLLLKKAMNYFLEIEEYEQCAKIRNLLILIENQKDETKSFKNN